MAPYSLYIDTSKQLIIGLLNSFWEFAHLEKFSDTKNSAVLYRKIFDILESYNVKPLQLKAFIHAAGPGSYTGIRLSWGMADIFQWHGIESYGFYHFEVPSYLGVREGSWIANAFKREVFCYSWKDNEKTSCLISESEAHDFIEKSYDHASTQNMIENNSKIFFQYVVKNKIQKKPYYFRPLDKEFKQPALV